MTNLVSFTTKGTIMERVLVGIDGEAASQTAVDWVIERAQRAPLHVKLLTAFDMLTSDPTIDQDLLRTTAKRIEGAAPGTGVETELADRSILEALVERSADADLMVIGSHPHRKVRSILTGALPSALVARSHCATVVVPDDWRPGGRRIVLGVADDESSDTATRFAAREAVAAGTSLDAVHAWRLPQPSMDAVSSIIVGPEELEAIHQELLQRVTDRLGDAAPGVVVRGVLRHGDPAIEIDEVLDDTQLLVLGTHGHGPTLGALLGSKVQHLLHHGGVPVAVVPLEARVDA
jgi:nucleotide-binding universal stress UspA family protein